MTVAPAVAERQRGLFGLNKITSNNELLVVLQLVGELDLDSIGILRDAIAERPPYAALVLDLRGLDFIDSSGLRLLLNTFADSGRAPGWRFGLVAGPASLRRTFEISGLAPYLPFVADPEDVLL